MFRFLSLSRAQAAANPGDKAAQARLAEAIAKNKQYAKKLERLVNAE
jgi:hypothetical protein